MKKNLNYYLNLEYTIRLKKNSDGSYFGEIEELTGCMTEGDREEEVLKMLDDAKKGWLEVAIERNLFIPIPEQGELGIKLHRLL